ncbi:acyclic terpene utilization AtuA family protein [Halopseudomonas pelagia]|uniref:acyclic terpene utilization AtuA family protein n=1 Tax=Halopseudomonas pelagia TaxID=553151 RepID=UPI0030DC044F|tara:strand:+ start:165817 stop:167604 length:1788 start_codon:yes stop_codon:yes gene_type:complete
MKNSVRIGCASAFWGDTSSAAAQLVNGAELDYLVFDYLAEVTLSIMAGARMKKPDAGYATDFVEVLEPLLPRLAARGIKVISNAGGVNPQACAAALQAACQRAGVNLKVAVLLGDDLRPQLPALKERGLQDMFSGEPLPALCLSANAYLGAPGIVAALQQGADIVITGRIVDSALVSAPLIHEFGWAWDDYDYLAQAALAGHLVECGAQCTGGNFTDWRQVPDYEHIGFPIAEIDETGRILISKPDASGGLISPLSVGEQLLYEIGDPGNYLLPDVICDFSQVRLSQHAANVVAITGATGRAPSNQYKVSATWPDGFKCTASCLMAGVDAVAKAERVSQAIVTRTRGMFAQRGWEDYRRVDVELLGSEATYGPHARRADSREVVIKIGVSHTDKQALVLFSREIAQAATGMAPGLTGIVGGRPTVYPMIRLFSFLIDKADCRLSVQLDEQTCPVTLPELIAAPNTPESGPIAPEPPTTGTSGCIQVPLLHLAVARSGDKGNHSNIGVMARRADYLPWIAAALSEQRVAEWMAHVLDPQRGRVTRWYLPGSHSLNFLLENSLGGGGVASLRIDPQGKAFAQQLLEIPISIPPTLLD